MFAHISEAIIIVEANDYYCAFKQKQNKPVGICVVAHIYSYSIREPRCTTKNNSSADPSELSESSIIEFFPA